MYNLCNHPKMKKIFLLLILAGFFACRQPTKEQATPEDILPKEKMGNILIDIHLAELSIQVVSSPEDSLKKAISHYYDTIFKIHHITDEDFFKSFNYYLQHPDLMDEIYQEMIIEMSKRESVLKSKP